MNIELDVNELNVVMNGLGNLPYVQSADLINKIRTQAQGQLEVVPEAENTDIEQTG